MTPAAGAPWRPLAALTAGVLVTHWLVLRGAPEVLAWARPAPPGRVLHTVTPLVSVATDPTAVVAPPMAAEPTVVPERTLRPAAPARSTLRSSSSPTRSTSTPTSTSTAPAATPAPPVRLPPPALWQFEATALHRGVALRGTAHLDWQPSGDAYEAVLRVNVPPLAARVQRSVGALTPEGLAPLRFSDRTRSEEATHFDRAQGRVVFSSNRPDAPLQAGVQDRVSVLLQLASVAAADPARLSSGTVVSLQTAGTRDAERWDFVVDGSEELVLPGGTTRAIKLTRAPQREYDLRLELWLGPGPDYAPVRLRLTPPNGDWLDMQWSGTDKR